MNATCWDYLRMVLVDVTMLHSLHTTIAWPSSSGTKESFERMSHPEMWQKAKLWHFPRWISDCPHSAIWDGLIANVIHHELSHPPVFPSRYAMIVLIQNGSLIGNESGSMPEEFIVENFSQKIISHLAYCSIFHFKCFVLFSDWHERSTRILLSDWQSETFPEHQDRLLGLTPTNGNSFCCAVNKKLFHKIHIVWKYIRFWLVSYVRIAVFAEIINSFLRVERSPNRGMSGSPNLSVVLENHAKMGLQMAICPDCPILLYWNLCETWRPFGIVSGVLWSPHFSLGIDSFRSHS
jgi:hypothetical protein